MANGQPNTGPTIIKYSFTLNFEWHFCDLESPHMGVLHYKSILHFCVRGINYNLNWEHGMKKRHCRRSFPIEIVNQKHAKKRKHTAPWPK